MGDNSKISWTDASWNPVTGCSRVSEGCRNCYAEALSLRFGWTKKPWTKANAAENVVCHPERLDQPLRWRRPRRVFVNSMSDLFAEEVPDGFIDRAFAVMALAHWHTFQVLTKRPERMAAYMNGGAWERWMSCMSAFTDDWDGHHNALLATNGVPPNVWLGTSVEDQRAADQRIPHLLETPAAVRFVSAEPLLGPVDLGAYLFDPMRCKRCRSMHIVYNPNPKGLPAIHTCLMGAEVTGEPGQEQCGACGSFDLEALPRLDWVIVGGESGPCHRPMDPAWAHSLKEQCQAAGAAFFYKQSSGPRPETAPWLEESDGSRWRWHQYPGELTPPERVEV